MQEIFSCVKNALRNKRLIDYKRGILMSMFLFSVPGMGTIYRVQVPNIEGDVGVSEDQRVSWVTANLKEAWWACITKQSPLTRIVIGWKMNINELKLSILSALAIVFVAYRLDLMVGSEFIRNAGLMGIHIPGVIKKAINALAKTTEDSPGI